jgi:uncharacterized Zn-finger protein
MDGSAANSAEPDPGHPAGGTEIIQVDQRVVACDGGDGTLGHPRVFLHIEDGSVMCPYCSRLYVLTPGSGPGTSEGAGHAS